jgi:hypothetical protein
VGTLLQNVSGRVRQVSLTRTTTTARRHLYTACACSLRGHTPTVWAVSQTPIYDQFRGERINAEAPATASVPQRGLVTLGKTACPPDPRVGRWCLASQDPDLISPRTSTTRC